MAVRVAVVAGQVLDQTVEIRGASMLVSTLIHFGRELA
jgi:hypothetical protein